MSKVLSTRLLYILKVIKDIINLDSLEMINIASRIAILWAKIDVMLDWISFYLR